MIEHHVQEPKKKVWQVFLIVLVLVIGVNITVLAINRMPGSYGGLAGLALIVVMAFYTSRLMNRKLASYTYRWDHQQLSIERKLGKRQKPLIEIPGDHIEWIKPMATIKPQLRRMKRPRKTLVYACRYEGDDAHLLQFRDGKTMYRLLFQPNQAMVKALTKTTKENGR